MSAVKAADSAYLHRGISVRNNTADSWWRDRSLRGLMWRCVILLGGQYINGYDGAVMSSLLTVPSFLSDMGHPDSHTLGLMTGGISLGYLVGLIPASISSDKFGRKRPAMFGCVFIILGTLIEVFKYDNHWAFFAGRMVVGFGGAFPIIAGSSHVIEVAHPRHATALSAAFSNVYAVGAIVASWTTFGCLYWYGTNWNWRLPALGQALGGLVQLIAMPFIPESPRWLVSVDRADEAHELLAKWHANGDMNDELVLLELAEIHEAVRITKINNAQYRWSDWLKTKGNRHRLFIVIFNAIISQWAGTGIITSYLSLILESIGISSSVQRQGINGGINIAVLAYCIPLSIYMKNFSRRALWLGSTVWMIICFSIVTGCSAAYANTGNVQAGRVVVAFIYLFDLGYHTAYGALYYAYMCPLLPTSMRTQGVAISLVVGYAMAFFNQYANPIAFAAIKWKYYLVYLGLLFVYLVLIYYFFPETKGLSPEESSVLLDGEEAAALVKQAGEAVTEGQKQHGEEISALDADKEIVAETRVTTLSVV